MEILLVFYAYWGRSLEHHLSGLGYRFLVPFSWYFWCYIAGVFSRPLQRKESRLKGDGFYVNLGLAMANCYRGGERGGGPHQICQGWVLLSLSLLCYYLHAEPGLSLWRSASLSFCLQAELGGRGEEWLLSALIWVWAGFLINTFYGLLVLVSQLGRNGEFLIKPKMRKCTDLSCAKHREI